MALERHFVSCNFSALLVFFKLFHFEVLIIIHWPISIKKKELFFGFSGEGVFRCNWRQESASGTGSPGSRSFGPGNLGLRPGLILKSGTGTGTQIQNFRDVRLGPGLKFEKSGTRERDGDASKNPGLILTIFSSGTEMVTFYFYSVKWLKTWASLGEPLNPLTTGIENKCWLRERTILVQNLKLKRRFSRILKTYWLKVVALKNIRGLGLSAPATCAKVRYSLQILDWNINFHMR